jgi:uncharacterized membrane protein YqgA involved in biofilm formation
MFTGSGTLINIITIVTGASLGVFIGGRMPDRMRALITDVLGLITILGAGTALVAIASDRYVDSLPNGWPLLAILASLLIGGVIGSAANLEAKLEGFGKFLRVKFKADGQGTFVEGFLSASLLFVIGPLAILGSISDGMGTGTDQLVLKSSLDFFAAMAFAASLGWGVAASAIPVGIYQGAWTVIGFGLGNILSGYQIDAMTIVGGLMLVSIGLGLLKIKTIAVGNLLPALIVAPILVGGLHQFI